MRGGDRDRALSGRDQGRVVGIAAATPGWWAVYHDEAGGEDWAPVAAWVVREREFRFNRRPCHVAGVSALDPTGEGWAGELIEQSHVEYVYDPRPQTLARYLADAARTRTGGAPREASLDAIH